MTRALALVLALISITPNARADAPDLGVASSALDAGVDAAPAVDAALAPPALPPAIVAPSAAPPSMERGRALRPIYKRPLFWISIVAGGLAVGAIVFGAVWAARYTPSYATVTF